MHFHPDLRGSDSGRLTIAFLFSLVLHALLLFYIRFAQPSWSDTANKATTLNVILEKTVAEVAPPAGIPQANLNSKGEAKIGVQAATPVPQKTPATVTLAQNIPRETEPAKVVTGEKILTLDKPAKLTVPEYTAESQTTKNVSPETTEEAAKPLVPVPSVENPVPKATPPAEEPKKIVAVEAAPERTVPEKPAIEKPVPTVNEPAKVEEPKPLKVEEPEPVKTEEPKPAKLEEPEPVKLEEPEPIKIEEPKPVKLEEPKPVKIEEPKPVKIEEPKPVKLEEPEPAKIEEPKPVKIEEPKPVKPEMAAGPKTSPFEGRKPDETRSGPSGYSARSMSEFGIEAARGLPKITDRKIMFGERKKIVGSKEQELRYVMYRDSVILKLQRVGQFNYPAAAARNNLGGSLVVQFSIRPDGSLEEISIVQPSPHEALNAGAEKIIKMCAPFSPLPENIRRDTDILTIRINWSFVNSRQAFD